MGEEKFLELIVNPLFDDDVVGVVLGRDISFRCIHTMNESYLVPVPRQTVSHQAIWEQVLAMDLA